MAALLKWRLEDLRLAAYMPRRRTSFRSAKATAAIQAAAIAATTIATATATIAAKSKLSHLVSYAFAFNSHCRWVSLYLRQLLHSQLNFFCFSFWVYYWFSLFQDLSLCFWGSPRVEKLVCHTAVSVCKFWFFFLGMQQGVAIKLNAKLCQSNLKFC